MEWLNKISKEHKRWVNYVHSFGEHNYAEDIVQEMYLKLHNMDTANRETTDKRFCIDFSIEKRTIKEDGTVNTSYIWLVLKTMFIDFSKQKAKVHKLNIDECTFLFEDVDEFEHAYGKFITKLDELKSTWAYKDDKTGKSYHYDKLLFDLYSKEDRSYEKLAEGVNIEKTSIFNTIKRCKQSIKDNLKEDWEDLINKDYELL